MVQPMMDTSKIIIFMVKALISGQMEEYTKVLGRSIRCMATVYSYGLMADAMKENIMKIRNMERVHSNG